MSNSELNKFEDKFSANLGGVGQKGKFKDRLSDNRFFASLFFCLK